jgi:hypothetical protein
MKIAVQDGRVIATHGDEQAVEDLYPGAEVFFYEGHICPGDSDPRPGLSGKETLRLLRAQRDHLLRESDWTQLMDSPLSTRRRDQWKVYRQSLRDLPGTVGGKKLHEVVWPRRPA